jgi:hypothetical protein
VLGHDRQQLDRRGELTLRGVGVAGDQKELVGTGGGHAAQQGVEVVAVAHHASGDVDRDRVAHGAQASRDLDGSVGAVLGRAGDRQADRLREVSCLFLAATEREDLKTRVIQRRGVGYLCHRVQLFRRPSPP